MALKAGCERCCSQSCLELGALGQAWGTAPGVGAAALSPQAASRERANPPRGKLLAAHSRAGGLPGMGASLNPGSFGDKPSTKKCCGFGGMMGDLFIFTLFHLLLASNLTCPRRQHMIAGPFAESLTLCLAGTKQALCGPFGSWLAPSWGWRAQGSRAAQCWSPASMSGHPKPHAVPFTPCGGWYREKGSLYAEQEGVGNGGALLTAPSLRPAT